MNLFPRVVPHLAAHLLVAERRSDAITVNLPICIRRFPICHRRSRVPFNSAGLINAPHSRSPLVIILFHPLARYIVGFSAYLLAHCAMHLYLYIWTDTICAGTPQFIAATERRDSPIRYSIRIDSKSQGARCGFVQCTASHHSRTIMVNAGIVHNGVIALFRTMCVNMVAHTVF